MSDLGPELQGWNRSCNMRALRTLDNLTRPIFSSNLLHWELSSITWTRQFDSKLRNDFPSTEQPILRIYLALIGFESSCSKQRTWDSNNRNITQTEECQMHLWRNLAWHYNSSTNFITEQITELSQSRKNVQNMGCIPVQRVAAVIKLSHYNLNVSD